jgi:hypothetical protein
VAVGEFTRFKAYMGDDEGCGQTELHQIVAHGLFGIPLIVPPLTNRHRFRTLVTDESTPTVGNLSLAERLLSRVRGEQVRLMCPRCVNDRP